MMKPVTGKFDTLRKAQAESVIAACPETIARMKANNLPKKDVLVVARVAGIQAPKKTFDIIPYCHPILLDYVEIEFTLEKDRVLIQSYVESVAKTGVEMEALMAASVAALTLYDMLKPVDKGLEILSTKLVSKKGGKSDFKEFVPRGFKAAV